MAEQERRVVALSLPRPLVLAMPTGFAATTDESLVLQHLDGHPVDLPGERLGLDEDHGG
jgi:hypothetical protein